ncbi:MAG TPA: ECF-type sigma factor [Thermoanaerobaculia bacterium]|nr:ECF-type sigma factor [Thermoanaerobaculia bacterium]
MATRTLTRLLSAWSQGDGEALDRLAPLVYGKLRQLASCYLRRERPGHVLETGALVNEAFLRLFSQHRVSWKNRSHFFAIAALMMRRVLIEHARRRQHAGRVPCLPLEAAAEVGLAEASDVLALDEALRQLSARHPQAGKIVELRFFGGLNESEISEVLGISVPTVKRRWRFARAWLHRYLAGPKSS